MVDSTARCDWGRVIQACLVVESTIQPGGPSVAVPAVAGTPAAVAVLAARGRPAVAPASAATVGVAATAAPRGNCRFFSRRFRGHRFGLRRRRFGLGGGRGRGRLRVCRRRRRGGARRGRGRRRGSGLRLRARLPGGRALLGGARRLAGLPATAPRAGRRRGRDHELGGRRGAGGRGGRRVRRRRRGVGMPCGAACRRAGGPARGAVGRSGDDGRRAHVLPRRRGDRAARGQRPALVERDRDEAQADGRGRPEQRQRGGPRPFQHAGAQQPRVEARSRRSLCALVKHLYVPSAGGAAKRGPRRESPKIDSTIRPVDAATGPCGPLNRPSAPGSRRG